MSSLACQPSQLHPQSTTMTYPLEQYAVESKQKTALVTCICSLWEFSRCARIAILPIDSVLIFFLAISISWNRVIYLRCHLESCRYSYKTQNIPHISPCPNFKPGREAVLRTSWLQRKWHRRRLLQKNNTERCLGTGTRYPASGERAELTHRPRRLGSRERHRK